jgi:hypothetical protein
MPVEVFRATDNWSEYEAEQALQDGMANDDLRDGRRNRIVRGDEEAAWRIPRELGVAKEAKSLCFGGMETVDGGGYETITAKLEVTLGLLAIQNGDEIIGDSSGVSLIEPSEPIMPAAHRVVTGMRATTENDPKGNRGWLDVDVVSSARRILMTPIFEPYMSLFIVRDPIIERIDSQVHALPEL